MSPKTFYVGIKGVIVNSTNKKALVLLRVKSDGRRYWENPGGRMDSHEMIHETLVRELNEEIINLPKNIQIGELINAYRLSHDIHGEHGLMQLFYLVKVDNFEKVELSDEHSEYKWVTLSEIDNLNDQEGAYIEKGDLESIIKALVEYG